MSHWFVYHKAWYYWYISGTVPVGTMHAYPRASARATQDPAYGGLVLVGALEGRPGAPLTPPDTPKDHLDQLESHWT